MIKDIIKSERPRERLLNAGASSLSNEELLSIILKTGTKNISVKDLSRTLLKEIHDITNLRDITYNKLIKIKGIGSVKAIELLASLELGKRVYYTNIKDKPVIITEEAEIVKLIYNLSEQNFGIRKISEYLRKNNILTATNTNFSDGKIFNILTNPFYTGKILYQGELHSGVHEPIITQEQYDIVNTKYNNKRYKVA